MLVCVHDGQPRSVHQLRRDDPYDHPFVPDVKHVSEGGFDEEAVEPLRRLLMRELDQYVTDHAAADMSISLIDFAVDVIYGVGKEDGSKEATIRHAQRGASES